MKKYDMKYTEFINEMAEFINALEGPAVNNADTMTVEEWEETIREEMVERDMDLTDEQIHWIINAIAEDAKNKYKGMGYAEFISALDEYIYTLEQGDLTNKDEANTKEEWADFIREEMKDHEEEFTDEQIGWIIEKLSEDGHVKEPIFYAVQETREDGWDYGSYIYEKAVEMLKEQGSGLIAVINVDNNFCEKEIEFDEI